MVEARSVNENNNRHTHAHTRTHNIVIVCRRVNHELLATCVVVVVVVYLTLTVPLRIQPCTGLVITVYITGYGRGPIC